MRGRNPYLIKKRNEFLIKRFYFWYELERKRRDDVLSLLSENEIFLDVDYIDNLLRQHSHLIKQIKRRKPTPRQLDDFIFEDETPTPGPLFL